MYNSRIVWHVYKIGRSFTPPAVYTKWRSSTPPVRLVWWEGQVSRCCPVAHRRQVAWWGLVQQTGMQLWGGGPFQRGSLHWWAASSWLRTGANKGNQTLWLEKSITRVRLGADHGADAKWSRSVLWMSKGTNSMRFTCSLRGLILLLLWLFHDRSGKFSHKKTQIVSLLSTYIHIWPIFIHPKCT